MCVVATVRRRAALTCGASLTVHNGGIVLSDNYYVILLYCKVNSD